MKMPGRAPNASLQLDYVRDTLFGPVASSVECQAQLAALTLQGRPALRLHICPPLPDKTMCHPASTLSVRSTRPDSFAAWTVTDMVLCSISSCTYILLPEKI